jgi:hypothetical protein
MNRLRRVAIVARLMERLGARGSWCGETHLQKAMFFLQELLEVSTEFDFILYKHGPFSFDLRDELTAMRADGLVAMQKNPFPYGPTLVPTEVAANLESRFPKTLRQYAGQIDFVANNLGGKGVADLERLATALWVMQEDSHTPSTAEHWVKRVHELKPHVALEEARSAVAEVSEIANRSRDASLP